MGGSSGKCVVVVADDFGKSSSVNSAVAEAHEKGIVTAASIMAGEEAFEEAARIARSSRLSVGLHVTLCDGRAVLPKWKIPDLVDEKGHFEKSPSLAWIKYSRAALLRQVDQEIEAQFAFLEKAGIHPAHVDSHHHIHMHPAVFSMLCRHASERRVRWIRIPSEPLTKVLRLNGRGALPVIEWTVFRLLDGFNRKKALRCGLRVADRVYGLSKTGHLDERYLLNVLSGAVRVIEIFSHPDSTTTAGRRELEALTSPLVRKGAVAPGIKLAGYRELSEDAVVPDTVSER